GGRGSNLQDSYLAHAGVLDQAREALARVSDGPVTWAQGRGLSGMVRHPAAVYPHHWSRAHEAAVGIAPPGLGTLVWPPAGLTDPVEQWNLAQHLLRHRWQALAMSLNEVADLQERIRRERAKLLGPASPEPKIGSGGRRKRRRRPPRPNEARDAWVARLREKTPPPPWATIYRKLLAVAPRRQWAVPRNEKRLSQAYYNYVKYRRKKPPKQPAPSTA